MIGTCSDGSRHPSSSFNLLFGKLALVSERIRITDSNDLEYILGFIDGMMGHATVTDIDSASKEFGGMLIRQEQILAAYKWSRDQVVFTTHRIIHVDVQGLTGKKKSFISYPYSSIHKFSKESAGWMDLDAELRIWIRGESEPIKWEFRKDEAVNELFSLLSEGVLSS